ncbi:MAG: TlyA family RNA methyltransferase [Myxococcaceae bacterium]|nr:TlyA family RNA methyltransferase [Myxococcaceae bacterium]
MKRERLDLLMLERGLAETRTKAQAMILAGQIVVGDQRVDKPGTRVDVEAEIRLKGEVLPYVSRGGLKLKAALDAFQLKPRGLVCADIGASTGGFTDCLLQEGAVRVHAIDVGVAQLHQKLRADPRVLSKERVNARSLTDDDLPELVDAMVIDVSFISLKLVLPAVLAKLKPAGWLAALVKPQFEVGREHVEKGGVVKDAHARAAAISSVRDFVVAQGFEVVGLIDCPVAGPAGNIEALLGARKKF